MRGQSLWVALSTQNTGLSSGCSWSWTYSESQTGKQELHIYSACLSVTWLTKTNHLLETKLGATIVSLQHGFKNKLMAKTFRIYRKRRSKGKSKACSRKFVCYPYFKERRTCGCSLSSSMNWTTTTFITLTSTSKFLGNLKELCCKNPLQART